jgi:hypothetical protein
MFSSFLVCRFSRGFVISRNGLFVGILEPADGNSETPSRKGQLLLYLGLNELWSTIREGAVCSEKYSQRASHQVQERLHYSLQLAYGSNTTES